MADHQIKFSAPRRMDVGKKDFVFYVHIDGEKQGELHISEGGLDWWPRDAKTKKRTKSWEQLRKFMES